MDNQQMNNNKDHSNAVVWGINGIANDKCLIPLHYPGVAEGIYKISEDGKIYSIINARYLKCGTIGNRPFVNLCCKSDNGFTSEPFFIEDLIDYNFH